MAGQLESILDFSQPDADSDFFGMPNDALREGIHSAVRRGDLMECLLRVAEMHGHICPGIAMGIQATLAGLAELGAPEGMADGMEDMLAIVETNACFSDAVQFVSGCTLGNNSLIYRDFGKTAVTFALRRNPKAVRVSVLPTYAEIIDRGAPRFFPLMDKVFRQHKATQEEENEFRVAGREAALCLLREKASSFLSLGWVEPDLPPYAPITASAVCEVCGESFMAVKGADNDDGHILCRQCGDRNYNQVEGLGIVRRSF